jgi:hypothetical protein
MWVWISTDGEYYAVPRKNKGTHDCDIHSVDGKHCWFSRRYEPTGFNDTDKRYLYPEFSHMTCGYSRLKPLRNGHHAFLIRFGDYDISIKIDPWTGNTCLKDYQAEFFKRVNIKKPEVSYYASR